MPFLQISDRTVVSAVKEAAWSPNKDLIACLTQDRELHAYREFPQFTRIWSLSFQSEPTSLCWHPDGLRLAVGHSDGSISTIDAENGHTLLRSQPNKATVLSMAWASLPIKSAGDSQLVHNMASRYRRHCPAESSAALSGAGTKPAAASLQDIPRLAVRDYNVLDVLCSADADGHIVLSAFGHFVLLDLQLASVLRAPINGKSGPHPKCAAQRLLLCPHLSRLVVAYGTDSQGSGTLGLIVCGLHGISTRAPELHALLLLAAELRSLCADAATQYAHALKALTAARRALIKMFAQYPGSNSASPEARWEEVRVPLRRMLQALFTTGADNPALTLFLSNKPGEHGIKQAARAIDASLTAAHTTMSVELRGLLERVIFLLDELCGLVQSSPAFDGLGIEASAVLPLKAEAAALCVRLEGLQHMVANSACLHRTFFQRLVWHARCLAGSADAAEAAQDAHDADAEHALRVFLEQSFLEDPLVRELQAGTLPRPGALKPHRRPLAPRNLPRLMGLLDVALGCPQATRSDTQPFKAALDDIVERATGLFAQLPVVFGGSVTPLAKMALAAKGKGPVCSNASLCLRSELQVGDRPDDTSDDASEPLRPRMHGGPADDELGAGPGPGSSLAVSAQADASNSVEVVLTCTVAVHQHLPDTVLRLQMRYEPASPAMEAVTGHLLEVGQADGSSVVEAHSFQWDSMVVLLCCGSEAAASSGASPTEARLLAVPQCALACVKAGELDTALQTDCIQMLQRQGAVLSLVQAVPKRCRWRTMPSAAVNSPLVVSVARALAAVCAMQRITVFDMLDDDDEGSEVEADEGVPGDVDMAGEPTNG